MLDDSDVDFAVLASWSTGGWLALAFAVFALIAAFVVSDNEKECAAKRCEHGIGKLVAHECLCVERPSR